MTDGPAPTPPPPGPPPSAPASWPVAPFGGPPAPPPPPPLDAVRPVSDDTARRAAPSPEWTPLPPSSPAAAPRRRALSLFAIGAGCIALAIAVGTLAGSSPRDPGRTANPVAGASERASEAPLATAEPSPSPSPQVVRIGISLPLSSESSDSTVPARDAVLLAAKDAQIPGVIVETDVRDDTVGSVESLDRAESDIRALAADRSVVAVVGPETSSAASRQLPISADAGLLQCSPSAEWYGLTQDGSGPDAPGNFVRLTAPDIDQGYGLADFAVRTLHAARVVIVNRTKADDVQEMTTKRFRSRLLELGGTVADTFTDDAKLASHLKTVSRAKPGAVFYAGPAAQAATIRRLMNASGMDATPLLLTEDGVYGPTSLPSFLDQAGKAAANTYAATSYTYNVPDYAAFASHFQAAYGHEPDGWALEAYACAQVVLEGIREAAVAGAPDRASVLANVMSPSFGVDTVLGRVSFTAAGDMVPGNITVYRADPATTDWVFAEQIGVQVP